MRANHRQRSRRVGIPRRGRRRGGARTGGTTLLVAVILIVGYYQNRLPGTDETVRDVLDGDSLVIYQDGERREVRLYAIDAPEKGQAFGREAKAFATRLAKGTSISLTVRDQDRYGRLVGDVTLEDGQSLNQALVEAGMAWWYRDHAEGDWILSRLESEAREAGRGLWADANPEPPWDYRRRLRDESP